MTQGCDCIGDIDGYAPTNAFIMLSGTYILVSSTPLCSDNRIYCLYVATLPSVKCAQLNARRFRARLELHLWSMVMYVRTEEFAGQDS